MDDRSLGSPVCIATKSIWLFSSGNSLQHKVMYIIHLTSKQSRLEKGVGVAISDAVVRFGPVLEHFFVNRKRNRFGK